MPSNFKDVPEFGSFPEEKSAYHAAIQDLLEHMDSPTAEFQQYEDALKEQMATLSDVMEEATARTHREIAEAYEAELHEMNIFIGHFLLAILRRRQQKGLIG